MTASVVPVAMQPVTFDAWATGPHADDPDPAMLISAKGNRWSIEGEPTIYAGSDPGVALAEYGRHRQRLASVTLVWALGVRLQRAVDLRSGSARRRFGLPDEPMWLLDVDRCRRIASDLRAGGEVDGLLVPSVAFPDQTDRWNTVIFVDRLPPDLSDAVAIRHQAATLLRDAARHG